MKEKSIGFSWRKGIDFWKNSGLLFLSVLSLLTAIVFGSLIYLKTNELAVGPLAQRLQQEIDADIRSAKAEQAQLKDRLLSAENKENTAFPELGRSQFRHYILRNGNLWFWSDYRLIPENRFLQGKYSHNLVWLTGAKYLLLKDNLSTENDKWELVSMVSFYRRYPVQNQYLQSGWLYPLFRHVKASLTRSSIEQENIFGPDKDFLFSLTLAKENRLEWDSQAEWPYFLLAVFLTLLFGSGYVMLRVFHWFVVPNKAARGFWYLLLWFGGWRLVWGLIIVMGKSGETSFYGFSSLKAEDQTDAFILNASIDLLLILVLMGYVVRYMVGHIGQQLLIFANTKLKRQFLSIGLIGLGLSVTHLFHGFCRLLYANPDLSLDIYASLEFDWQRWSGIGLLLMACIGYFLVSHLLTRLYLKASLRDPKNAYILFGATSAGYLFTTYLIDDFTVFIVVFFALYHEAVIRFRFTRYITEQRYQTYLYFFACALMLSALGGIAGWEVEKSQELQNKIRFAELVLSEKDNRGAEDIEQMNRKIREDDFIRNRLADPSASKDLVIQKILKVYVPKSFEKYSVQISLFNSQGGQMGLANPSDKDDYQELYNSVNRPQNCTEYNNIYLLNELKRNVFRRYVSFVPLRTDTLSFGYIVIDFKLKKINHDNVYPELLVGNNEVSPALLKNYSYAIFESGKIAVKYGTYNYLTDFKTQYLSQNNIYQTGIWDNDIHHIGLKGENDQIMVVSSILNPVRNLTTNFSALFFVQILFILTLISAYLLTLMIQKEELLLTTKIQIFLNTAFFLPLLLVSSLVLSVMSNTYRNDLNQAFLRKAEEAAQNLSARLIEKGGDRWLDAQLVKAEVADLARTTNLDLNFFSTNGKLLATSQQGIYDNNVLSKYINPIALYRLLNNNQGLVLLTENVGKLGFKTAYLTLRATEEAKAGAILSVPYFDSSAELGHQITDVAATLLRIFSAIFILFLGLSYYLAQQLILPLKILNSRLKRTGLSQNQPLEWRNRRDEIGMLISEYNNMLQRLEASRDALSKSEKESAWREMAQQVAHEIKNPLTPMKLTLQHLQRAIAAQKPDVDKLTDRAIETLLLQIDILNDIATSFSAFAKMPVPKNEVFELNAVVRQTVELFQHNTEGRKVHLLLEQGHFYVRGDEKLMGRILTNLLLNAFQAIPQDRSPVVSLQLQTTPEGQVLLSISDNGMGISELIKPKIFIPNFTTKSSGAGIGLAVAKRGIEHSGGQIWFKTSEGEGTTFYIELPVV